MARSRYAGNEILDDNSYGSWQNKAFTSQYRDIDLLDGVQHFEYVFVANDRLDHLAARFFNDDQYYWVIALINNIQFPLTVTPGTTLRIPINIRDVLNKLF